MFNWNCFSLYTEIIKMNKSMKPTLSLFDPLFTLIFFFNIFSFLFQRTDHKFTTISLSFWQHLLPIEPFFEEIVPTFTATGSPFVYDVGLKTRKIYNVSYVCVTTSRHGRAPFVSAFFFILCHSQTNKKCANLTEPFIAHRAALVLHLFQAWCFLSSRIPSLPLFHAFESLQKL